MVHEFFVGLQLDPMSQRSTEDSETRAKSDHGLRGEPPDPKFDSQMDAVYKHTRHLQPPFNASQPSTK